MDKDMSREIFNKRKKASDKKAVKNKRMERSWEKNLKGNF